MNERARQSGFFFAMRRIGAFLLLLVFATLDLGSLLLLQPIPLAEAAEVVINDTVQFTGTRHTHTNAATVFTTNQDGYRFYVNGGGGGGINGSCVYVKTTDGGDTWGG